MEDERRPAAEAAAVALLHAQHAVWARSHRRRFLGNSGNGGGGGGFIGGGFIGGGGGGGGAGLASSSSAPLSASSTNATTSPVPICTHGNAALHLVALHDRPDTYNSLLTLGATPFVRNGWGQSPLALAAAYGSVEMFKAGLAAISETVWVCGSVSCVRTPLEEIDTLFKHVGGREFKQICCGGGKKRGGAGGGEGGAAGQGGLARSGDRQPGGVNVTGCGGYVNGSLGNCGRTTVYEVVIRRERADLITSCPQLRQIADDKWNAYGKYAIVCDAVYTFLAVVCASIAIAFSPSAVGPPTRPDCSALHAEGTFEAWGSRFASAFDDPSFMCTLAVYVLVGAAGTERLFAGTCRVLPVLADWWLGGHHWRFQSIYRLWRRLLAACFPVYIPAAGLDGAYWTFISISVPFHPIMSPPVARAFACTLGGDVVDGSMSNILLGLGALVGVLRLFYAGAIINEKFGAHLLAGASLVPISVLMISLTGALLIVGFAAVLTPTFSAAGIESATAQARLGLTPGSTEFLSAEPTWWHTLPGAIGGLCLLLFGKFDLDELLASAFPATSGAIFGLFLFSLVILVANVLIGAASIPYAKRFEAARARQQLAARRQRPPSRAGLHRRRPQAPPAARGPRVALGATRLLAVRGAAPRGLLPRAAAAAAALEKGEASRRQAGPGRGRGRGRRRRVWRRRVWRRRVWRRRGLQDTRRPLLSLPKAAAACAGAPTTSRCRRRWHTWAARSSSSRSNCRCARGALSCCTTPRRRRSSRRCCSSSSTTTRAGAAASSAAEASAPHWSRSAGAAAESLAACPPSAGGAWGARHTSDPPSPFFPPYAPVEGAAGSPRDANAQGAAGAGCGPAGWPPAPPPAARRRTLGQEPAAGAAARASGRAARGRALRLSPGLGGGGGRPRGGGGDQAWAGRQGGRSGRQQVHRALAAHV